MIKARFDADALNKVGLLKQQVEQAITAANADLYNALVDTAGPYFTPIDTGFARASWFMQVDGGGLGKDMSAAAESVGRVFSVVNTAAYIGKLEDGHSSQNQGFVAGAANAYEDFLQARVAQVKGTGGS